MDQSALVSRIAAALGGLRGHAEISWSQDDDGADLAVASGQNYRIQVYVNASRALSLEFSVWEPGNERSPLQFNVDSDLYPIGQPKYEEFAQEVGQEILAFLDSLVAGEVRVGTYRGRFAMVVPVGSHTVLVYRGRFTTTSRHMSAQDLDRLSDLKPVHDADL